MKTIRRGALLIAALFAASYVQTAAQIDESRRATVQFRDGTTVSGEFEDIENDTLYLRVSIHDQRRIDVNRVALIDFVDGAKDLPRREVEKAAEPGSLAVLRSGQLITTRLADVEHEFEGQQAEGGRVWFVFDGREGRDRRVPVEDLKRVYFGQYRDAARAMKKDKARTTTAVDVIVPATQLWTPTGIQVREGQMVRFSATGEIILSQAGDVARPAGSVTQKRAAGAPLPTSLAGALIGQVGTATFGIGDQAEALRMPATGTLILGINDDRFDDNSGQFQVNIIVDSNPVG